MQFFVRIFVAERVFDRPQELVADLQHGLDDYIIMAWFYQALDIDGLALLQQHTQIAHHGTGRPATLLGNFFDRIPLPVELQDMIACE